MVYWQKTLGLERGLELDQRHEFGMENHPESGKGSPKKCRTVPDARILERQ
jgi:hypothetical protein